jgi:hypothetical protein
MSEIRDKLSDNGIRKEIFALFCITVIAILCILKLADPENILINIIIAIGSFAGGEANQRRKMDNQPPATEFTQTTTRTESAAPVVDPIEPKT